MQLTPGTRIGPYEVTGQIGAGGMGEVYRAHDARLNRDVALKVLPAGFADDPNRVARFQREAQVLAALSHPNIASIYGLEESGGIRTLVMELVEGPDLAERLRAGPIPLEEALAIARQIADALEAAHEKGIVHRDLKPANIKVAPEGKVKVLDFGLAKALSDDPAGDSGNGASPANSPTLTLESTRAGMILGTAGYMSPEQARGKPVDKRADIWAFGVVLYEMLAGHTAFEGETVSDSLAAILRAEIEWHRLPADTPAWVRRLLQRCLERDPKRRLRDIGDAWIETDAPVAAAAPTPARNTMWWLPWAAAAVLGGAGVTWGWLRQPAEPLPRPVVRSEFTQEQFFGVLALSRDGSKLAYCGTGSNAPVHLVLRMEDQLSGRPVPGGESAVFPFFSPDGQWIAYFSLTDNRKLKKIPITGGTPISISDSAEAMGASWPDDDTILFGSSKGVMRVPAAGGSPVAVTKVDEAKGEIAHRSPQLLPGGRALLFTIVTRGTSRVAVVDLKKGVPGVIAENAYSPRYAATGHVLYLRGNGLFAVPFDARKLAVAGSEVPLVDSISGVGTGVGDYDISDSGTLVYMAGAQDAGKTVMGWADRKGAVQVISDQLLWGTGRLSPDGKRIANEIQGGAPDVGDIWIVEIERKTATRLTFEGRNAGPIWTPDGRRLVWGGKVSGKTGIFWASADGSGKPQLALETEAGPAPGSFTPDGRILVYAVKPPGKKSELWAVALSAGGEAGKPYPVRQSPFEETSGELSPDGKWLAYVSTESGGREVYVQPFPGPGSKVRISTQGGYNPRWSRSGREMFFWGGPALNQLTTVEVQPAAEFRVGTPASLFNMAAGSTWDVAPDGKHFLIEQLQGGSSRRMITAVNWFEELKQRAPVRR